MRPKMYQTEVSEAIEGRDEKSRNVIIFLNIQKFHGAKFGE